MKEIRHPVMEEIRQSANLKGGKMMSKFSFLNYAVNWWVAHAKQSDSRGVPQDVLLQHFAGPSKTLVETWMHMCRELDECPHGYLPQRISLLHVMLERGMITTTWAILNKADQFGIDTDEKDSEGRTPLMLAAGIGNEAIARLLLDKGADLEAEDFCGRTPLMWATVDMADISIWFAHYGKHPQDSCAAEEGRKAVAQLLLERGADSNAMCKCRYTPLSRAIMNNNKAAP
ncbi:hypothetical protein NM208_g3853 [Fusarium decemcellulare]|uniref:Uncharacterized protein n=1 Tax=Fusarium decemcellulare TaxID=57161 RepID=A0ACC1SMQ8_9HYPO|nr:hypothetical protein NM208_g3853 [Fusarium decemcellulare]